MASKKSPLARESRKITFGVKKSRKGIHSKKCYSKRKSSKLYKKRYRGQGR